MESIQKQRSLTEQKLIYLYLLDRPHHPYSLTKKQLAFDTNIRFYANVNQLARMGLINQHPLLVEEEPDLTVMRKAKATSLTITDTSYRALLWAVDGYDELPEMTEEEALEELKRLARAAPRNCLWDWE
jgi:hypothetical protein